MNRLIVSTQRVSPFYRDLHLFPNWSSCCHERNVYRFPENGTCFLSKQRVSPFYHDLELGLVGLVGNLLLVEQLLLLVVEQLLNNSFIQSCFKEIFGGGRGDAFFCLVYDCSRFHPNNYRDTISWEDFNPFF